jgi:hypothetical protein
MVTQASVIPTTAALYAALPLGTSLPSLATSTDDEDDYLDNLSLGSVDDIFDADFWFNDGYGINALCSKQFHILTGSHVDRLPTLMSCPPTIANAVPLQPLRLKNTFANLTLSLYLKTYGIIDTIDKYISNANIGYRSWKYWHAAMNHAKAMGLAVAYDMYKECAEGGLDPQWKVNKPVSYHKFHNSLSRQLLQWDPAHQLHPGDNNMLKVKQVNKTQRVKKRRRAFEIDGYKDSFPLMSSRKARKAPIQDSVGICQSSGVMQMES